MYKFDNGQISLEDFEQPVGMHLKNENRWVKKAHKDYLSIARSRKPSAKKIRKAIGKQLYKAHMGFGLCRTHYGN
mgnify:CR=1 FL=1